MAVQSQVENISIEPSDPRWGNEEVWCVEFVNDVAGNLAADYISGEAIGLDGVKEQWYAWLSDGVAVDPALGGTGIEVSYTDDDSAEILSGLYAAAINASAVALNASDIGLGKLLVQNKYMGEVADTTQNATSFTLTQQFAGSRLDLGFTEEIELSMSELLVDVTAAQNGAEPLTRLRNGNEVGPISIGMKESDAAKLKQIIEVGGSPFTPAGGTEVSGWGRSKNFTNVITDTKKLVLHPTRKDITDESEDWAMWRAYPNLSSLNFSGESERIVTVEFTLYQDNIRVDEVSKFVFGDSSQNYLK